jgi:hypothetical protein
MGPFRVYGALYFPCPVSRQNSLWQCICIRRLFPSYIISGFRREADENCALLGYYAANSGDSLSTFRDDLSVPYSRIKMGLIGCTKTSKRNYHYSLRNNPEERSSLLFSCSFNHLSILKFDENHPVVLYQYFICREQSCTICFNYIIAKYYNCDIVDEWCVLFTRCNLNINHSPPH